MKKITFLILATTLSFVAAAQSHRWEKKPMSDFRNDTVAYIRHNFNPDDKNLQEYFKGKTIGEIVPELGLKIRYVSVFSLIKNDIDGITLVAITKGNMDTQGEFEATNGVLIILATPISPQNNPDAYNKLKSATYVPCNKELLELIKDIEVKYIERTGTITIHDK